jgi:hypothetical protein
MIARWFANSPPSWGFEYFFSPPSVCPSPIDWGRGPGAIFAMAARENRDGTEGDLSSGFFAAWGET